MTAMANAPCVVDMLNPYDHEDADLLTRNVEPVVGPIARCERNMSAELVSCADVRLGD
jgi:hypothetical protein